MIAPTPLSLFCALLLCLPLAIVFTFNTPSPSTTTRYLSATLPPPPPLPEDDRSLFRLASAVNPHPSPTNSPPKLAFLFLTTAALPLAPLWELFFNHTPTTLYNIYIHIDPNSTSASSSLRGVLAGRVIHSKPTRRHTPTLISAARRLLSHALLHDPLNSMFAILSPSCIPLHSFTFTYQTLMSSNKSFIEILDNEVGAYGRWAARGEDAMLPEVPFEEFRIGSQFFVLTRHHARVVVGDVRLWSRFKLPCLRRHRRECYPEEHYFSTLLNVVDPRGCVPTTLTHVDWKGSHGGHPRAYNGTEVGPDLIRRFRRERPRYGDEEINGTDAASVVKRHHPFLFARKFSPDTIGPLLEIANEIILED